VIESAQWEEIRRVLSSAAGSSFHVSVASVAGDGAPVVTPIGSLFLHEVGRASYIELHATGLARRLDADPRLSILAVNSRPWTWLHALLTGRRFDRPPAVRLVGRAVSPSRPAGGADRARFARRVGLLALLPGARRLWRGAARVREVRVERIEPVGLGPLTARAGAKDPKAPGAMGAPA